VGRSHSEDIVDATECFDEKYCVGSGGYGSVFRAELERGREGVSMLSNCSTLLQIILMRKDFMLRSKF
jgi:hypothetical protein